MAYAEKTGVAVEKSRMEIERLLQRKKAAQYVTAVDHEKRLAVVQFKLSNRLIRFDLMLPDYPKYTSQTNLRKYEQAERQKWRALLLVLKAKMEAIESGISTLDSEFLAHMVIPGMGGRTVGEYIAPQLERVYEHGSGELYLTAGKMGDDD